jgi:outer membrane protein assembly factor BamB
MESAPVYVANVPTPSGTKDLLFASANNKTLLALNAADGSILWHQEPAGAALLTRGSPAVDPALGYVYWHGADGKVHKYQTGDGIEITTGGWPETSTLKPDVEESASGLTIASTPMGRFLYSVTSGYYGTRVTIKAT